MPMIDPTSPSTGVAASRPTPSKRAGGASKAAAAPAVVLDLSEAARAPAVPDGDLRTGWERAKAIGAAFRDRFDRLARLLGFGRATPSPSPLEQVYAAQRAFAQQRMVEFNGAAPHQLAATNAMVRERMAKANGTDGASP